ncbi:MAG: N-acetyl-gamma-glutamyl-phosphate reductase [Sneathiella sp.]|nr:N-acetyl-gamma-glutamyl-phosphate reductase [Sneathiella sp.]
MVQNIFIDGSAGTTGLQIQGRLGGRSDIALITLTEAEKKDPLIRAQALNDADISILCLPDAAARESVSFACSNSVRIIDTSTAHRVDPGWVYGLPEYAPEQADLIRAARRVSNPGCYPTGPILCLSPLVRAGILPASYPVSVAAVSGYSGGGRQMIEQYEDAGLATYAPGAYHIYGLQQRHKHLPEMHIRGLLNKPPAFVPSIASFPQGMMTEIALDLSHLNGAPTLETIHRTLAAFYEAYPRIEVIPLAEAKEVTSLDADMLANSDQLQIYVFGNAESGQVVLVAVYDNLGKGASGAAVQNLDLMLEGGA